jgi:two-component system, OmpR family, sensor kinase
VSLKRRLVAGTLVLLVAGIVTADLVTASSLRSFLYGRIDEQIDAAQETAYNYISSTYLRDLAAGVPVATKNQAHWLDQLCTTPPPCSAPTTGSPPETSSPNGTRRTRLAASILADRLNPDVYAEVIDAEGTVVFSDPSGSTGHPDPAPLLPKVLPVEPQPATHQFGSQHGAYVPDRPSFEVSSQPRGTTYRVQAVAVPGGTLVTATSLNPTNQTLASLTHVELLVSIVVVLGLLVLALWIVRIGLQPLQEMAKTAGAIAEGDLTRRIRRTEERSEVGRLGAALNGMLSQIEAAFAERTASESRLRRFVADASHELRTPLTSIRGYAELLRKGAWEDEPARLRAAERIEHEASRMGLLVDDLLLLARLDQGRPFEHVTVDLGTVVHDAVEAARAASPDRSLFLEVSGTVLVAGDAARLRQVLDNLLRNAAVHTPAGTPVRVSVHRAGPRALVTVADEGPGLTSDQAERLFDRFYQGSEARTGEGTGLGLSIVAALATAHGGRAYVRSTPGRGSVFVVELPAVGGESGSAPDRSARPRGAVVDTAAEEDAPLPGPPGRTSDQGAGSVRR